MHVDKLTGFLFLFNLEVYPHLCQLWCWERILKNPLLNRSSVISYRSWQFWLLKKIEPRWNTNCWTVCSLFWVLYLKKLYGFLFSISKIYCCINVLESSLKKTWILGCVGVSVSWHSALGLLISRSWVQTPY